MGKKRDEDSAKALRRQRKKVEKQIQQGKKKIVLPDGSVLNGRAIKAQRRAGSEQFQYMSKMQRYLTGALVLSITARVFTAWSIPAGFRVLVFLLCVPIYFALQLMLNLLVPAIVDRGNPAAPRVVREAGGYGYFPALFVLAMSIEFTKFSQFVISVVSNIGSGAGVADDEGVGGGEGGGGDGDGDGGDYQRPKRELYDLEAQSDLTKMFLYGVPFIFGSAVVFFSIVSFFKASTGRDPPFYGNNIRLIALSLAYFTAAVFAVSSVLEYIGSDSFFLHPLWATAVLVVSFLVSRMVFNPDVRAAVQKSFADANATAEVAEATK